MLNERISLPDHWRQHGVLAAVSGGADSTGLLHFLAEAFSATPDRLAVGHVNHGLRGGESDEDARFVENLAAEYGLRYFLHRIEPEEWNADETGSREAAARNIRYDFLLWTARSIGFRYIATAHTADDQAETVLHRVLRGTGVSGLSGISRYRQLDAAVTLIRPLLNVRRRDILEYLEFRGKPYRIDATNAENEFTRNRIRNRLLPELRREFNPKVDDALCRLARLAADHETVSAEMADEILETLLRRETAESVELDGPRLRRFSKQTVRELLLRLWKRKGWPLREMGLEQWESLAGFALEENGCRELPGRIEVRHEGDRFIFGWKRQNGYLAFPSPEGEGNS